MKSIAGIFAALLLTITAFALDGRSIYNRYSDAQGVSAVYVSPAMFRLIGKVPDMSVGGDSVNLAPLIRSLNGLYLIDSSNSAINGNIRKDVEKFVTSGHYELLMETKDNGEVMHIYTTGNKEDITGFVLLSFEESECTFICIDGRMSRSEFEDLIAKSLD